MLKARGRNPKAWEASQAAAICWRVHDINGLEVLSITSRDTQRWIIPRGNIEPKEAPYRAAQREAFEEAGILGKVRKKAIGLFKYKKDGGSERVVSVHILKVRVEADTYAELGERRKAWLTPEVAAGLLEEEELKVLFQNLRGSEILVSQDRVKPGSLTQRGADGLQPAALPVS